jgi:hypothetical protein
VLREQGARTEEGLSPARDKHDDLLQGKARYGGLEGLEGLEVSEARRLKGPDAGQRRQPWRCMTTIM